MRMHLSVCNCPNLVILQMHKTSSVVCVEDRCMTRIGEASYKGVMHAAGKAPGCKGQQGDVHAGVYSAEG